LYKVLYISSQIDFSKAVTCKILKLIFKLRRNYKKPVIQVVGTQSFLQHINTSKVSCFKAYIPSQCNWLEVTEIPCSYKTWVVTPRSQKESHTFRKNLVPSFSEFRISQEKQAANRCFLVFPQLHGVTAQKTPLFIVSTVRTSNPKKKTCKFRSLIFYDVTLCFPLKVNRRFGGTYRLSLQGRRISERRNQHDADSKQSAYCLFHAGFGLCLFFDPEDWGKMYLRNIGWISANYMGLYCMW
jgi:hypothetical protein